MKKINQTELERKVRELAVIDSNIFLKNTEKFFENKLIAEPLLVFAGIFVERFADGVPARSRSHEITHKIIGIKDYNGNLSGNFLCDTQEKCVCGGNYCGANESYITLNSFDERINPESLKKLKNLAGVYGLDYYTVRDAIARRGEWSDEFYLDWKYGGNLVIRAMSKGGFGRHPYEEKSFIEARNNEGLIIQRANLPLDQTRELVAKIRKQYLNGGKER